ncbi:mannonate dehydratase [Uliginosibacterium sp. sgz301328]|uniref:mannonate dehydratase n=1 Tax=Uliginosibacterium sp. sgz301328 TaxID=3243764 RepID=UPI00359E7978
MYIGTQFPARNDDDYRVMAQLGLKRICANPPGHPREWTLDALLRHREHIESFGLELDMIQLPMSPRVVEKHDFPDIMMAGPKRDEQIDFICKLIENAARVGIPAARYNLNMIGIPRSEPELGRGGSINDAFRWDKMDQNAPPTAAGVVDEDENWARIDYFLERVVPVAESNRVRIACHPHDPYTPDGYRGVKRVLGTVEGLKKFVQMHESPYHGLNFCQGTVAEMLEDPATEIFDVIRWFGERGKIFNVHFRNIRGCRLSFMETFPDEGDMDMWKSLLTYAEVGYQYMLMPDHVPHVSGGDSKNTAFGFTYGYITAMLEVLRSMPKNAVAR